MNTSSETALALALGAALLAGCSQGPWEYYPEESEAYRGVYVTGTVIADRAPQVCLNRTYALDEDESDDFAFYDSASVRVSGLFAAGGARAEKSVELKPAKGSPNCFEAAEEALGVPGEAYGLSAVVRWDSAGRTVTSRYSATARIPEGFSLKEILAPVRDGEWDRVDLSSRPTVARKFLDYPDDMLPYKVVTRYGASAKGIYEIMRYDNVDGGEPLNTTMMNMIAKFTSKKRPPRIYAAEDETARFGYNTKITIGNYNSLDTLTIVNMTLPAGKSVYYALAVDEGFELLENSVKASFEDPRIVPRSNVVGGSGGFSGMLADSIRFDISSDSVYSFARARVYLCEDEDFDTKFCRSFLPEYCADSSYRPAVCDAEAVAAGLEAGDAERFLRGGLTPEERDAALLRGTEKLCIRRGFPEDGGVDCSAARRACQEDEEENGCKEALWAYCADAGWRLDSLEACGTALVSRLRLKLLNSTVIRREADAWCAARPKDPQCAYPR